ncbi:hypothetical protein HBB16_04085 [Pseudonocardia sp. MCCB 268]|nr:hypothetical protein [Pseudonocardia cytotoxica]
MIGVALTSVVDDPVLTSLRASGGGLQRDGAASRRMPGVGMRDRALVVRGAAQAGSKTTATS